VPVAAAVKVFPIETIAASPPKQIKVLFFEIFKNRWEVPERPRFQLSRRKFQHFQGSHFGTSGADFEDFDFLHFELRTTREK
jgi:hypothetical protein